MICSRLAESPRNSRSASPAPPNALTAMPVNNSVTTSVRPFARETTYTNSVASSPPANAKIAMLQPPRTLSPSMMPTAAPTAAPDETPTTPGSASGLPKMACITAPATASAAPTPSPMTMRGNRTTHRADSMTRSSGAHPLSIPSARRIEPITSVGATGSCPTMAERSMPTARATPRPAVSQVHLTEPGAAIPGSRTFRSRVARPSRALPT